MIAEAGTVVPSVKTSELPSFSRATESLYDMKSTPDEVVVGEPHRLDQVGGDRLAGVADGLRREPAALQLIQALDPGVRGGHDLEVLRIERRDVADVGRRPPRTAACR